MIDVASGSFILIFIILTQSSDFLTLYYSIRKISLTKKVVSIHVMAINEFSKKYLIEVKFAVTFFNYAFKSLQNTIYNSML